MLQPGYTEEGFSRKTAVNSGADNSTAGNGSSILERSKLGTKMSFVEMTQGKKLSSFFGTFQWVIFVTCTLIWISYYENIPKKCESLLEKLEKTKRITSRSWGEWEKAGRRGSSFFSKWKINLEKKSNTIYIA